jgi:excisionase family DNA binding protein
MATLLTTREFADAIGASESSVRRWTNSGVIATARTAGGHRRIALADAIRFIRESGTNLVRPELLGLPALPTTAASKTLGNDALVVTLYDALVTGDAPATNGCVAGLFLNGMSAAAICDTALQPAMQRIGEFWKDDSRGVLTEHRATGLCLHALNMLRRMMGDPADTSPVALGGAPDGDPYLLPTLMAGTVVAEAGYRDINFGPDTPMELLAVAAAEHHARLVWLSIKAPTDCPRMRKRINALAQQLASQGSSFVIGGTGVDLLGLRPSKDMRLMRTMTEFAAFAQGAVRITN